MNRVASADFIGPDLFVARCGEHGRRGSATGNLGSTLDR